MMFIIEIEKLNLSIKSYLVIYVFVNFIQYYFHSCLLPLPILLNCVSFLWRVKLTFFKLLFIYFMFILIALIKILFYLISGKYLHHCRSSPRGTPHQIHYQLYKTPQHSGTGIQAIVA